jgi:hypothetical protein
VRTGASIYTMSDQASLLALVERALRLPSDYAGRTETKS